MKRKGKRIAESSKRSGGSNGGRKPSSTTNQKKGGDSVCEKSKIQRIRRGKKERRTFAGNKIAIMKEKENSRRKKKKPEGSLRKQLNKYSKYFTKCLQQINVETQSAKKRAWLFPTEEKGSREVDIFLHVIRRGGKASVFRVV